MQTYSNRSNAARAARAAAIAAGASQPLSGVHFQVAESSQKPGEFEYFLIDVRTGDKTDGDGTVVNPPKPEPVDAGAAFDEATPDELAAQAGRPSGYERGDEFVGGQDDDGPSAEHSQAQHDEEIARAEPVEEIAQVDVAALPAPPAPQRGRPKKATAKAPAADKGPKKSEILIGLAKRPEGVTNAQIKDATGWSKLGGFFDAVKRSGLTLVRRRELGDTRWFAVEQDGKGRHVFVRREAGGPWTFLGNAPDAKGALKLAALQDAAIEDGEGREASCLFVAPRTSLAK